MDQFEQAIDNLQLKALASQSITEDKASQGQIKYVLILNEYEKELRKLETGNP